MDVLKRKVFLRVCAGLLVLYAVSMWGLTNWKAEDLTAGMHHDFMRTYTALFEQSAEDGFLENAGAYLTEFSAELAQRNVYAVAVILDKQGNILARGDLSGIALPGRAGKAADFDRLSACVRDAQAGFNHESFSKEQGGSMGLTGPAGYTQGWTLGKERGDARYAFVNAKFFERELVLEQLRTRYVSAFIVMAAACLALCAALSRVMSRHKT